MCKSCLDLKIKGTLSCYLLKKKQNFRLLDSATCPLQKKILLFAICTSYYNVVLTIVAILYRY